LQQRQQERQQQQKKYQQNEVATLAGVVDVAEGASIPTSAIAASSSTQESFAITTLAARTMQE
jgi:hypothetical protein